MELSIVLVIIGLLIGGILAAQSMIENAKMKRFHRILTQVEVITDLYEQRFAQLPGDDPTAQQKFGADLCGDRCSGDGNGIIQGTATSHYNFEGVRFWHHLKLSGLLDGSGIEIVAPVDLINLGGNFVGLDYVASKGIPEFKDIENNIAIVGYGDPSVEGYGQCNQALLIGKANNGSASAPVGSLINGTITQRLNAKYVKYFDMKFDDYVPNTGKVMAHDEAVNGCMPWPSQSSYATTPQNGYAPKDQECAIMWCMDK